MDHFENIQSTNWQTMRFKPPPVDSPIGWRVEFRSMEVQLTDFENAAFSVFIVLLTRAILSFNLNFYMPISKVRAVIAIVRRLRPVAHPWYAYLNRSTSTCNGHRSETLPGPSSSISENGSSRWADRLRMTTGVADHHPLRVRVTVRMALPRLVTGQVKKRLRPGAPRRNRRRAQLMATAVPRVLKSRR